MRRKVHPHGGSTVIKEKEAIDNAIYGEHTRELKIKHFCFLTTSYQTVSPHIRHSIIYFCRDLSNRLLDS
jgi:hypothetical protein